MAQIIWLGSLGFVHHGLWEASHRHLKVFWEASWATWEASGDILEASGSIWEAAGSIWDASGKHPP